MLRRFLLFFLSAGRHDIAIIHPDTVQNVLAILILSLLKVVGCFEKATDFFSEGDEILDSLLVGEVDVQLLPQFLIRLVRVAHKLQNIEEVQLPVLR